MKTNKPQIFNHSLFGELPVVVVDGIEWFGATEAARSLSFSNPYTAIPNHIDEDDLTDQEVIDSLGRKQNKKFTNESGLYSLIFGAAKQGNNPEIQEKAKAYKKWVTGEVLPTIRKTGGYVKEGNEEEFIQKYFPSFSEQVKQAMVLDLKHQNNVLQEKVKELEPKAKYVDTILKSKGTVTTTQIAKDYGLTSRDLNEILHDQKIQFKVNNQWVLYKEHANKGYTQSYAIDIERSDGTPDVKMNTRWTQRGRLFIHELLTELGYKANIDRDFKDVN